jgi:hypothetical protein
MPALPFQVTPSDLTNYTLLYQIVDSSGNPTTISGISINSTTGVVTVAAGTADNNFRVKITLTDAQGGVRSDYSDVKLYNFSVATDSIPSGTLKVGSTFTPVYSYTTGLDFKYDFGGASIDATKPTTEAITSGAGASMLTINPDSTVTVKSDATVGTSVRVGIKATYYGAEAQDDSGTTIAAA